MDIEIIPPWDVGMWYLRALSLEKSSGRTGGVQSEMLPLGLRNSG